MVTALNRRFCEWLSATYLGIKYWKGEETWPSLTIISEKTPCSVCEQKIGEFMNAYSDVTVFISASQIYTGNYASTWTYEGSVNDYHLMLSAARKSPVTGTMVPKSQPKPQRSSNRRNNMFDLLSDLQ